MWKTRSFELVMPTLSPTKRQTLASPPPPSTSTRLRSTCQATSSPAKACGAKDSKRLRSPRRTLVHTGTNQPPLFDTPDSDEGQGALVAAETTITALHKQNAIQAWRELDCATVVETAKGATKAGASPSLR